LKILFTPIFVLLILVNPTSTFAQEWKNLKTYQKETGYTFLQNGNWLKKDRKKQKEAWKQANLFNLSIKNGNQKYKLISQKRDFYLWFDLERKKQGHKIIGIGVTAIVSNQLSKLDCWFIRFFIIRNKEVVKFVKNGSTKVFDFTYPLLKEVYFSDKILKGETAKNWDLKYGKLEQCQILEPLYAKLSSKSLYKLDRMVKGKGIFNFGIPKKLKFVGNLKDCQLRFEHRVNKVSLFYINSQKKLKENIK